MLYVKDISKLRNYGFICTGKNLRGWPMYQLYIDMTYKYNAVAKLYMVVNPTLCEIENMLVIECEAIDDRGEEGEEDILEECNPISWNMEELIELIRDDIVEYK